MGIFASKPQLQHQPTEYGRNSDEAAPELPGNGRTQHTAQKNAALNLGLPQRQKSDGRAESTNQANMSVTRYRNTLKTKVSTIINLDSCDVTAALETRQSKTSLEAFPASSSSSSIGASDPSATPKPADNKEDAHTEDLMKSQSIENIDAYTRPVTAESNTSSKRLSTPASLPLKSSDPVAIPVPSVDEEDSHTEVLVLSPHSPECSPLVRYLLPGEENKIMRQVVRELGAPQDDNPSV
jgi:hypothetical protein